MLLFSELEVHEERLVTPLPGGRFCWMGMVSIGLISERILGVSSASSSSSSSSSNEDSSSRSRSRVEDEPVAARFFEPLLVGTISGYLHSREPFAQPVDV